MGYGVWGMGYGEWGINFFLSYILTPHTILSIGFYEYRIDNHINEVVSSILRGVSEWGKNIESFFLYTPYPTPHTPHSLII